MLKLKIFGVKGNFFVPHLPDLAATTKISFKIKLGKKFSVAILTSITTTKSFLNCLFKLPSRCAMT
jgi:hypothetical protein